MLTNKSNKYKWKNKLWQIVQTKTIAVFGTPNLEKAIEAMLQPGHSVYPIKFGPNDIIIEDMPTRVFIAGMGMLHHPIQPKGPLKPIWQDILIGDDWGLRETMMYVRYPKAKKD